MVILRWRTHPVQLPVLPDFHVRPGPIRPDQLDRTQFVFAQIRSVLPALPAVDPESIARSRPPTPRHKLFKLFLLSFFFALLGGIVGHAAFRQLQFSGAAFCQRAWRSAVICMAFMQ